MALDLVAAAFSISEALTPLKIIQMNEELGEFGIVFTPEEARELSLARIKALRDNGRVEFDSPIMEKIIRAFAPSLYIAPKDFAATVAELSDGFYYFKNQTNDALSDDFLINFMQEHFNSDCGGSCELLFGRDLEILARKLRYGNYYDDEELDEKDEKDEKEETEDE